MGLVIVLGDLFPECIGILVDMQHVDSDVGGGLIGAERKGNRRSCGKRSDGHRDPPGYDL